MVAEVGVHDYNKVSGGILQAVDVCSSKTELTSARLEDDVLGAPDILELFCDFEGAVGGAVVDDDDLPI